MTGSTCQGYKESFGDAESRDNEIDVNSVRKAQFLTGELLWLPVRARLEVSFPVARMAQLSSKYPKEVAPIGKGVLKYLQISPGNGLLYGPAPQTTGETE